MTESNVRFRHKLGTKLIIITGCILFCSIATWSYFNIKYYRQKLMEDVMAGTDKLTNTIRLGAHYAMMLNSRHDIDQIINNVARQKDIQNIRIYNKEGQIKFSNTATEKGQTTNIKDEACHICHHVDPPLITLDLKDRIRVFRGKARAVNESHEPVQRDLGIVDHRVEAVDSAPNEPLLGIITPIYNEPSCSAGACHFHPSGKQILGALDVVISLKDTENEIFLFEKAIILAAVSIFILTSATIFMFLAKSVTMPIKKLISGIQHLADGYSAAAIDINRDDEIGQLADSFNRMQSEILKKQTELTRSRNEYQELFEGAPWLISVQDRNYRLLRYNREFAKLFDPRPGDYCYQAYKGRTEKCPVCPVEQTFEDGLPHHSEETRSNKDGTQTLHWMVTTAPIMDANGEVVAAMEMCLDISYNKRLEQELEDSVKKYYAIFNNIPNPVFVLDMATLVIMDCNESVTAIYDYAKNEILGRSFLDLFVPDEREHYESSISTATILTKVRQIHKSGRILFVTVRVSPSQYHGRKVFLVTTSDITKRLEAEQQLVQAGKMTTLGEMATGVAHELNQPLTVIKTASNFFMKKIRKGEKLDEEVLFTMSSEIDRHVDRATKIMNHMREFGRKSDMILEKLQINEVLRRAFEFFGQQLKLRGIKVVWSLGEDLPMVMGDAGRLEQVFINLLMNARDAIDEKWAEKPGDGNDKQITVTTTTEENNVVLQVSDKGKGIPEALLDRIFEPFFTTKQVGKGTGLGLSISYGIIQDCGGTIRAVSKAGEGATFIVTFPIPDETTNGKNPLTNR